MDVMEPEALELELEKCIVSESHQREHIAGLLESFGDRPLSDRAKLQLQFLVLQEKLKEGTIDDDVVAVVSDVALQLKDGTASIQHHVVLRTQAVLHILEGIELPLDDFTDAVEDIFEASDAEQNVLSPALEERKTELLHFFRALSECGDRLPQPECSMGHADVVAAMTHSYPKAEALAALQEFMELVHAHLQTTGPPCSSVMHQADPAMGASAEIVEDQPGEDQLEPASSGPLPLEEIRLADSLDDAEADGHAPGTAEEPPAGSQDADEGPPSGVQQLFLQQTQTDSDVDIVNTPSDQSAVRGALRMPSRFAWEEPAAEPDQDAADLEAGASSAPEAVASEAAPAVEPDQEDAVELAAGGSGDPQDAEAATQLQGLTESEQLVPDSYPSEPQPELTGEPRSELNLETQYQDAAPDQEMPDAEMADVQLPAEGADGGAEEEQTKEDGLGTENQENCSLQSNSQVQAAAAPSQGKKGSQEGSVGEKGSQDRPQRAAPSAEPDQQPHNMESAESPPAVLRESLPLRDLPVPTPEAAVGRAKAAAAEGVHADGAADAGNREDLQGPAAEVGTDVEESYHNARDQSSSDAESEDDSSESNYDSPSWQPSTQGTLYGSEQQIQASGSQLRSQAPVLHLSLGANDLQRSQPELDSPRQGAAQSDQGPSTFKEAGLEACADGVATAPTEEDNNEVSGSMARMTVLTKPDALAQPRRHKAKRRTQRAITAPAGAEQSQQPASAAHQRGSREAAHAAAYGRDAADGAGAAGSRLKAALAQPMTRAEPAVPLRAAVSGVPTPDEVVWSLLQRPAVPASCSPRGLTELLGLIQTVPARGAAPAAAATATLEQAAAGEQLRGRLVGAQEAAAAAAVGEAVSDVRSAAGCRPGRGDDVTASEVADDDADNAVAEPAWRSKGQARSSGAPRAEALEAQLRDRMRGPCSRLADTSGLAVQRGIGEKELAGEESDAVAAGSRMRRLQEGLLRRRSTAASDSPQAPSSAPAARRPAAADRAVQRTDMAGYDRRQSMPQMTPVDLTSLQPISAKHSAEAPPARRLSAPAITPGEAGNDNNGPQESWNSFIAGLSFSDPKAAQPEAARTATRQLPAAEEAAPRAEQAAPGQPRSASPPLRSAQGPAQAQALPQAPPVQDSRGRSSRMSELRFSATDYGLPPGSRAPAVPAEQPLPAQPAPPRSTVLQSVHPSALAQNLEPRGRDTSARPNQATGAAAAAAASREKRAASERQQADSVPGVITAPAAKRRRVQGGNLWDLANSVMVDMAQRLMPVAPSMHSAPPQAPLPAQQPSAAAAAAPPQEPATEAVAPVEQTVESSACPTPPAVQTAALRSVVEAAIANPGAVALPTLVPLRFQKANQKADAAVRAMSARRSIAQQPATPPVHAPHAPQPAVPAGLGQPHRPSRLQPRPTSAAGASVQPGWDEAAQPQTQQPSPGQFADEATPSVDRSYIADMQYGAAQPPHARSVQQPLTQLPSPGYDDSPVSQWPQQPPPAPQPGRPLPVQDAPRGARASAYPWEMPAGSAAQQEEFDVSGHHLGVQRSREQRQWPGQQEAPQSRPVSGGSRNGFERGADNAAAAAQREWLPGAQGTPLSAAHGQGMRSVMHPGQPQSWAPSAAPRETGHVQQHQQDFSFPRQQAAAAPSQHFGPPHDAAFGYPTHASSPWQPAQPAQRPDFDRQQARSPQPAYAQGYQHSMATPPQAPYGHVHGHSHPASGVSAGYPGFNTGAQAGEPDLRYGSSFPAQQQQQLQGPTMGGSAPMGGQPLQQLSAGWDAAYGGVPQQQQQQWQGYQQPMVPAGHASEQRSSPMQQPGGSLQHVAVAPPQQQGQQYLPVRLSFGGWS